HVTQAGMQGQAGQSLAVGRQRRPVRSGPGKADRAQQFQRASGAGQGGGGRGRQPGKFLRPGSPTQGVQQQRGGVRFQYFGAGSRGQDSSLVPQAQTHAGFGAARPARALIRPVAGNAFGDQTVEARGRIKTHGAGQARVDHHPYPFNGQAGFGYGGGEHDFAAARRGGGDGRVLVGGGQIAVQGMHGHAGPAPGQSFGGASDFTRAGQKSQNAAGFFGEGQAHGPFHGRNRVR